MSKKARKQAAGLYPDTPQGVVYVEVFPAVGGKWAWERIGEDGKLDTYGMNFPDAASAKQAAEDKNPDVAIMVVRS